MTSFSLPTSSIRQPQSLLELVKDLGSGYLLAKERKISFIYFNFLLEAAAAAGAVNINRWQILFNDFVKWIKIWRERNPRRCSCSLSPRWSSWSPRCPPGPRKGEAQAMLSIFSTSLHFNSSQIMFCATSRCKHKPQHVFEQQARGDLMLHRPCLDGLFVVFPHFCSDKVFCVSEYIAQRNWHWCSWRWCTNACRRCWKQDPTTFGINNLNTQS